MVLLKALDKLLNGSSSSSSSSSSSQPSSSSFSSLPKPNGINYYSLRPISPSRITLYRRFWQRHSWIALLFPSLVTDIPCPAIQPPILRIAFQAYRYLILGKIFQFIWSSKGRTILSCALGAYLLFFKKSKLQRSLLQIENSILKLGKISDMDMNSTNTEYSNTYADLWSAVDTLIKELVKNNPDKIANVIKDIYTNPKLENLLRENSLSNHNNFSSTDLGNKIMRSIVSMAKETLYQDIQKRIIGGINSGSYDNLPTMESFKERITLMNYLDKEVMPGILQDRSIASISSSIPAVEAAQYPSEMDIACRLFDELNSKILNYNYRLPSLKKSIPNGNYQLLQFIAKSKEAKSPSRFFGR